jgi:hypothetical protein
MKKYLLLALLLIPSYTMADALYLGGVAYHWIENKKATNDENYFIGVEHDTFVYAFYKNSYGQWNTILAKRLEFLEGPNFKGAINAGINHGYYDCLRVHTVYKTTCPMVGFEVSYTKYEIQPTLVLEWGVAAIIFRREF